MARLSKAKKHYDVGLQAIAMTMDFVGKRKTSMEQRISEAGEKINPLVVSYRKLEKQVAELQNAFKRPDAGEPKGDQGR